MSDGITEARREQGKFQWRKKLLGVLLALYMGRESHLLNEEESELFKETFDREAKELGYRNYADAYIRLRHGIRREEKRS